MQLDVELTVLADRARQCIERSILQWEQKDSSGKIEVNWPVAIVPIESLGSVLRPSWHHKPVTRYPHNVECRQFGSDLGLQIWGACVIVAVSPARIGAARAGKRYLSHAALSRLRSTRCLARCPLQSFVWMQEPAELQLAIGRHAT